MPATSVIVLSPRVVGRSQSCHRCEGKALWFRGQMGAIRMGVQVCLTLGKWPHPAEPWERSSEALTSEGLGGLHEPRLGTAPGT